MREVAEFFGTTETVVKKEWRKNGMPGDQRRWNLSAIARWRIAGVRRPEKPDTKAALEDYRSERARVERLRRMELEGTLVRAEVLHALLMQVSASLRKLGEQMQREFGAEAHRLLNEGLEECEREIEQIPEVGIDGD